MKMTDVKEIERTYPAGTRIFLEEMAGENQMPYGLKGTVTIVDGRGQIHVNWENGSSLALNVDVDKFHIITEEEPKKGRMSSLSHDACLGYAKIGMERARVHPDTILKVLRAMENTFQDTSVETAAYQFCYSQVRRDMQAKD